MAQALALPDKREVLAVSSGAALASETLASEKVEAVSVIGDARRQQFWMGIFEMKAGVLEMRREWQLYDQETLALPAGIVAVSPEMDRLRECLPLERWDRVHWIQENRYPSACTLAKIAAIRCERNETMEPLQPLYMHPPV